MVFKPKKTTTNPSLKHMKHTHELYIYISYYNTSKPLYNHHIKDICLPMTLYLNIWIYKILLGEADLPVGERHNPFMKGLSYTDKVMKKATELINNDKTR